MKLYVHPFSSFARRASMTALLLDLAIDSEFVDLMTGKQREPAYLALNPNAKVPVLVDGDFVLWESNAICQYLADKKPGNTLWPADQRTRIDIARWMFWESGHWFPALQPYFFENMIKKFMGLGDADPAELKKAEEKLVRFATVLDGHLAGRDYLVGNGLTLADLAVATDLTHAAAAHIPLDGYGNIARWFGQIQELPAWQQTNPPAM
ncbi:MAG: glutathione S-transferase family protein [Azospirillum sp.]|nr:glutathione S-transferase family protein [Azospirillum sp.]